MKFLQVWRFGFGVLGSKELFYQCPRICIHIGREYKFSLVIAGETVDCLPQIPQEGHPDEDLLDVIQNFFYIVSSARAVCSPQSHKSM